MKERIASLGERTFYALLAAACVAFLLSLIAATLGTAAGWHTIELVGWSAVGVSLVACAIVAASRPASIRIRDEGHRDQQRRRDDEDRRSAERFEKQHPVLWMFLQSSAGIALVWFGVTYRENGTRGSWAAVVVGLFWLLSAAPFFWVVVVIFIFAGTALMLGWFVARPVHIAVILLALILRQLYILSTRNGAGRKPIH